VAGDPTELPRIQVVFSLWQCDKQNHGCPGGTATDRLPPKLRSGGPAFTLRQSQFRTKKEYCFALVAASSSITTLAGIKRLYVHWAGSVNTTALGRTCRSIMRNWQLPRGSQLPVCPSPENNNTPHSRWRHSDSSGRQRLKSLGSTAHPGNVRCQWRPSKTCGA
jgi:hypothetical protein